VTPDIKITFPATKPCEEQVKVAVVPERVNEVIIFPEDGGNPLRSKASKSIIPEFTRPAKEITLVELVEL